MQASGLQQPLEGIKAIASLVGGAIVIWIVYMFGTELLPDAKNAAPGGHGGLEANAWLNTGLDTVLPFLFLALVFFGLVMQAVLSRRYS